MKQIRQSIINKEIKKGGALLPEKEMAELMGVSRSAVSDAISNLSILGIIEKRGNGNYIGSDFENIFREPFSLVMALEEVPFEDITDIRLNLELLRMEKILKSISSMKLQELDSCCKRFKDASSAVELMNADKDFHNCLAKMTNSKLITILLNSIYSSSMKDVDSSWKTVYKDRSLRRNLIEVHNSIYTALKAEDPRLVEDAMREHFAFVKEHFNQDDA